MADYDDLVTTIITATTEFNRAGAAAGCATLIERIQGEEAPPPAKPIKKVLGALRNKRYFDLMESVADAAIQSGQTDPQVQRQYGQALIDQGNITAAIGVLKALAMETAADGPLKNPSENAEARGILGRAYKQAYVNAVNPVAAGTPERQARARANRRNLEAAIDAYRAVYESDPARYPWQGINTVACVSRAQRDGIARGTDPNPRDSAQGILDTLDAITPDEKVEIWDRATAVEACVALDDPKALDWLARYATDRGADAFELASTLRQLEEVWELTSGSAPGSRILPLLRSELLQRQGGGIQLAPKAAPAPTARPPVPSLKQEQMALEAVLGDTRFVFVSWYKTGLNRCEAVARIDDPWGGSKGSGFLVRGEDLHPRFKSEVLLLTNAHVVSDDPIVQSVTGALLPERARVAFELRDPQKRYRVKTLLWTSPPGELDATLLRLEDSLTCDPPYPLAITLPIKEKDRMYVIGHPSGGPLSMSLQDNRVVDVKDPWIQYRAPTETGSSGSPVFNQDWELVALHHAGSKEMTPLSGAGFVEANEGVWINAVVAGLAKKFDAAPGVGG